MNYTALAAALRNVAAALEAPEEVPAPAPAPAPQPQPALQPVNPTPAPQPALQPVAQQTVTPNDIIGLWQQASQSNADADQIMGKVLQQHGFNRLGEATAEQLPALYASLKSALGL